jgi:hypothetical protein
MTQHNNILFYEPQPKASDFRIQGNQIIYIAYWNTTVYNSSLPPGEWEIVGLSKEMTEDKWKKVVRELPVGDRFENYSGDYPVWHHSATASGLSLMRHLGLDEKQNYLILKLKEK